MLFTPLHRLLGVPPGPITNGMLDAAVTAGIEETDDLDWKGELIPSAALTKSDFPKDVAAMANRGGGMLVYGVKDSQKAAVERIDVGEILETYERTLLSVAITAISPPVFGLTTFKVGENPRALCVVVPSSVDGPHLIYRNEYFGAPIRNAADTVWMRERELESLYRARFDERRNSAQSLDNLYADAAAGRSIESRAWLIAVAQPRIPNVRGARLSRDDARATLREGMGLGLKYATSGGRHPFEDVALLNPRSGLRRWVAPSDTTANEAWRESWISVHDDGSATVAAAIGGARIASASMAPAYEVEARRIECCVADLMGLVRTLSNRTGSSEYQVRVGIEWSGGEAVSIISDDGVPPLPVARFRPVTSTVVADADSTTFAAQVYELALDCVNQGGIRDLQLIPKPDTDEDNG